jgi:hypothetical protein
LTESINKFINQPDIAEQLGLKENIVLAREELIATIPYMKAVNKQTGKVTVYVNKKFKDINENQKKVFVEILSTLKTKELSQEEKIDKLNKLKLKVKDTSIDREKITAQTMLAIAEYSQQYWTDNAVKWKAEFISIDDAMKSQSEYILQGGGG